MKWITDIEIENYRAFAKKETIKIPHGSHLLIYGENGSGKSSIYHAVQDFFKSSVESDPVFDLNIFEKDTGNVSGSITLSITDNNAISQSVTYTEPLNSSNHNIPEIILANKVKGFLDYKRLLQIHALEIDKGKEPNFFNLIIKELLGTKRISDTRGGVSTVELLGEYNRISEVLLNSRSNSVKYKTGLTELEKLNREINNSLATMFDTANSYLIEYFNNKTTFDYGLTKIEVFKPRDFIKKALKEELILRIFYAGQEIESYHHFLNEARLSSLAVCLYLASIKTANPPEDTMKVLFLDDVFIGLDAGNRIPLLEIIKEEFIEDDYQVFLSTYDRHWYELSRQWLESRNVRFKPIELFSDTQDDDSKPDIPKIIDKDTSYIEKARIHFNRFDYPASANYLRKACEKELKRILPENLKLVCNKETGEVKSIDKLETLVNHFFDFLNANNLVETRFQDLRTLKKVVMNPLSHDDLEAPHYKKELKITFDLIEKLQAFKIKEVISAKDSFEKPLKLGVWNSPSDHYIILYQIILLENLYIIPKDNSEIVLSKAKCRLIVDSKLRDFDCLNEALKHIWQERACEGTFDVQEIYKIIKVSSHKKLSDLIWFDSISFIEFEIQFSDNGNKFKLVPGLADSNLISFQSQTDPVLHLSHRRYILGLHQDYAVSEIQLKNEDSTFKEVPGLVDGTGVSYESYNYPNHFITKVGDEYKIVEINQIEDKTYATFLKIMELI